MDIETAQAAERLQKKWEQIRTPTLITIDLPRMSRWFRQWNWLLIGCAIGCLATWYGMYWILMHLPPAPAWTPDWVFSR